MWIRVDVATPDGRKARRLARILQERGTAPIPAHDPRAVLGTLVMLWLKTRVHAPDGVLDGYATEDVADLIGCTTGEAEALLEAGWLERAGDAGEGDAIAVHEWMEHNGDHLREAQRKRASRASKSPTGTDGAPAGAASSLVPSVRPVPSRHTGRAEDSGGDPPDVRGTSTGRARTRKPKPDADPEPGPAAPAPEGPQDSAAPRRKLFTRYEVPEHEWDAIDTYCGLTAADTGPEAQHMRLGIATMAPADRAEILEPLLEANRQRVMDLLGVVGGGRARSGASPADLKLEAPQGPQVRRVNVNAIADMTKGMGKTGQAQAIRLAQWLFNRGIQHDGLLKRFIRHYADHASAIREPFAYYNPGREGFEFIRTRCAADHAIEEHEALKAAEIRWLHGNLEN